MGACRRHPRRIRRGRDLLKGCSYSPRRHPLRFRYGAAKSFPQSSWHCDSELTIRNVKSGSRTEKNTINFSFRVLHKESAVRCLDRWRICREDIFNVRQRHEAFRDFKSPGFSEDRNRESNHLPSISHAAEKLAIIRTWFGDRELIGRAASIAATSEHAPVHHRAN